MNMPNTFGQWVIAIIIILAILAVVIVGAQYFGFVIPQIVWTVLGILAVAALLIVAVKFLLGLGNTP